VLVLAFTITMVLILRSRAHGSSVEGASFGPAPIVSGAPILAMRVLIGLALTGVGAWLLVAGCMRLAAALSLNPLILGLFVPGLACALAGLPTALMAARRGRGDFALAQGLLGALANCLLLLGGLALWQPLAAPESLSRIELPVLLALAVALYPMTRSDGALSRREGGVLLAIYAVLVLGELWLTFA
jgi:cation:H+ antiporter